MTQAVTQQTALPRSTPEAQGISSAAISAFVAAVERDIDAIHSFMLLRHGNVVAEGWWEPYRPDDQHILFSLSKSFTSSAIGMLVAEGRLSIDDPVLSFFPEEAPADPSPNLQAMRVRHLLSMSTGHAIDTTGPMAEQPGRTWVAGFLAQPVEHEPGTHFLYNTGATYTLSAIVHKLSGGRLLDYLQPRLFAPLGILNPHWEQSPQGIDVGGWGLSITTADIAAFGQLYLQKGEWQGAQLIPTAWVEQATSRQVQNGPANPDWQQGYGFQFWRCRHNAYRGDGAFGQYCVVMPDQDAILAITSGLSSMQPPLDLIWEHLLPAMGDAPLSDDAAAQAALTAKLGQLQLRTPQGQQHATIAERIGGKTFTIAENTDTIAAIGFDFGLSETTLTISNGRGEQRIRCSHGAWLREGVNYGPFDGSERITASRRSGPWNIGTSGAWTDDNTFTVKLWWYETPFARTFTCRFAGDKLTVEQQTNVGFGATQGVTLQGQLAR